MSFWDRILNIECCEYPSSGNNLKTNCNLSVDVKSFNCGNRQLHFRDYIQYEKFREPNRGWGLRSLQDVSEGSLIIEYQGEVIDEKEMIERMSNQRKNNPNDHDFYIMQLDTGFYVDGKHKGNYSRFINHACDPNCELQRWIVQGTMRIGIFAIRDIAKGEALSYDYQFDTREENVFNCHCESIKCRGTMAPAKSGTYKTNQMLFKMQQKYTMSQPLCAEVKKGNNEEVVMLKDESLQDLTAAERKKLLALAKSLEMKMTADVLPPEQRTYVSRFLPGDSINEVISDTYLSIVNMLSDMM